MLILSTTVSAESRFPLRISDNGKHLVDWSGRPFLIQGDSAWSLFTGLTEGEAKEYLSTRKRQGFNTIMINVLDDSYPYLKDGTQPFRDKGVFSKPDERYFQHIENLLLVALNEEQLVMLIPVYLGCCKEGWKTDVGASSVEEIRQFGRYLGSRFRKFPNVWWVLGGDRDPDTGFDGHPRGLRGHINALAEGIKIAWPQSTLTAHTGHNNSARREFPDAGWLNVNNIYTYYPEDSLDPHVYVWAYREYERNPPMPFFLIESAYEDDGRKQQTQLTIRRQVYWAILSGACGHLYGHGLTWGMKADWRRGLDAPGVRDLAQAKTFFDGIPWYRLRPDLDGRLVVGGQSEFGDDRWASAALADDGSLAVVYIPQAMEPLSRRARLRALFEGEFAASWSKLRKRSIRVDFTQIKGVVSAAWFFPATGLTEEIRGELESASTGVGTFEVPCRGDKHECDAVLVLRGGK